MEAKGIGSPAATASQPGTPDRPRSRPVKDDPRQIVLGAGLASAILGAAILTFAFQPSGPGMSAIGTGIAIAGGALAVGGFLGLLFGIPRALQQPAPPPEKSGPDGPAAASAQSPYGPNTNLTEISDWLTKIIVGVSLTQLGEITDGTGRLVRFLADGFGGGANAGPFVAGLLAMSSVTGFLAGYLLARLYLPKALRTADMVEIQEANRIADQRVEDQAQLDAQAIRIIEQQLNPSPGSTPPTPEQLEQAIRSMSTPVRQSTLARAMKMRKDNWESDKERMERTIPLFRAYLKIEDSPPFWARAELGYGLKDMTTPDNLGAAAELTKAIDMRDRIGAVGYPLFEFSRAVVRIRLAPESSTDPAAIAAKEAILEDLAMAARADWVRGIIERDEEVAAWMARNKVPMESL